MVRLARSDQPSDGPHSSSDAYEERSPRLLVAEDDPDFLALLTFCLRRDGYRVSCVSTANALLGELEAIRRGAEPPALLITDQFMPDMHGIEVLTRVRDWGWTLPLVLITAFPDPTLVASARRLDVTLMRKPFAMDDLRTLVGYLVPRGAGRSTGCAACGSRTELRWWDTSRTTLLCRQCQALLSDIESSG